MDALAQFDKFTDEQIVANYLRARRNCEDINAECEAKLAPIKSAMEVLEQVMLKRLNDRKANNTKTAVGTAYKTIAVSATMGDRDLFLNYVRDHGAWSLLTNHVSKEEVKAVMELTGSPPPGVNVTVVTKVNFKKG